MGHLWNYFDLTIVFLVNWHWSLSTLWPQKWSFLGSPASMKNLKIANFKMKIFNETLFSDRKIDGLFMPITKIIFRVFLRFSKLQFHQFCCLKTKFHWKSSLKIAILRFFIGAGDPKNEHFWGQRVLKFQCQFTRKTMVRSKKLKRWPISLWCVFLVHPVVVLVFKWT